MTVEAIAMMSVAIIVIWGGLAFAVVRLTRAPRDDQE